MDVGKINCPTVRALEVCDTSKKLSHFHAADDLSTTSTFEMNLLTSAPVAEIINKAAL